MAKCVPYYRAATNSRDAKCAPYHNAAINSINGKGKLFLFDKAICSVVTVQAYETMETYFGKPKAKSTEDKAVCNLKSNTLKWPSYMQTVIVKK